MSDYGVDVSVCNGSLKAYAERLGGNEMEIIEGISKVPTGELRMQDLQVIRLCLPKSIHIAE